LMGLLFIGGELFVSRREAATRATNVIGRQHHLV
jgi:hypothetical protein